MTLNETPVRTSKNFKINDVEIDVKLPEKIEKFKNVRVLGTVLFEEKLKITPSVYGTGKEMFNNVQNMTNNIIKIKTGESEKTTIIYELDDFNTNLVNYVEIYAEKDAEVIIEYKASTSKECFVNSILRVNALEGIKLNICLVNLLNNVSNFFVSMENNLEKCSDLQYTVIDLGAKNSIQNYYSNIYGEKANNCLKSIYIGGKNEIKDINYITELTGKSTNIDIDVQGALMNNAKKNFKGTINFKKGCKKAVGNENEYCMLLSKDAKSIALPMLLCTEDDMQGNHATASGKFDDKELFYIMSRGLDKKEATKLIVNARFNSILERINNEELRNEISKFIDKRLEEEG